MKASRRISSICLLIVVLVCMYSTVKAGCSKHLVNLGQVPPQPRTPAQGQEPQICVSNKTCCTSQLEGTLKQKAVRELKDKVDRRLDGLKSQIIALRQDLKVQFQEIIKEAKRKNVDSLQRLNFNISRIGIPLVVALFDQAGSYIDDASVNLTTVVMQFFRDAFPPLFNYATGQSLKFSNQFEKCLKNKINTIHIFGNSPVKIASQLENVLKPMQVLLQSLSFASRMVDDTKALGFTKGCPPLLLQMKYCALCNGEGNSVKPCENYCIDVLKSCLTTNMQVQSHWGLYFDAMRDLSTSLSRAPNMRNVLYAVFHELSLAIYQAVPVKVSDPNVKAVLFQACGQPQFSSGISMTNGGYKPQGISSRTKVPSLKETMYKAKREMTSVKISYEQLPLDVCVKERVAAPPTEKVVSGGYCWNGTAMARYTGPVSSPLPSLEALPQDTGRITNLVRDMKTNIETIKKYTVEYEDEEGSATSGDSNVIPGSGECDDEDDESCFSGEGSGGGSNRIDNNGDSDTNKDLYLISTTPNPNELDTLGGGQSNVKGSGKNDAARMVVCSTLNLLLLIAVLAFH